MKSIKILLTDKQVASRFGVARSSIWRWAKQGVLPEPIEVGGRTRWVEAEINAVIERAKAARPKAAPATKRARVRLGDE